MLHRDLRITRGKFLAACLLVSLGFLPGCYGNEFDLGEVTGKVLINGQPVKGLTLTFQPESNKGTTSVGYTDAEGHYFCHFTRSARGAIIGKHTVSINHWPPDDAPPGTIRYKIPARYNNKSELHVDVKPGKNNFDFDLILDNAKNP